MKRTAVAVCLFLGLVALAASALSEPASAINFYYETPAGRQWQTMQIQIQGLQNQIVQARTSEQALHNAQIYRRIAEVYQRATNMFRLARCVTPQRVAEQQYYSYMAHACEVQVSNSAQNAQFFERQAETLRRSGR